MITTPTRMVTSYNVMRQSKVLGKPVIKRAFRAIGRSEAQAKALAEKYVADRPQMGYWIERDQSEMFGIAL